MVTIVENQEASGSSIFWALTAIVLNAMLQSSFTGYLISNNGFDGSLWPHRSSPFVCLYDMAMELWFMLERRSAWERVPEPRPQEQKTNATGAVMKLAVFILGVLPQAIKLFTMSGIPMTQSLAAMFLLPSLINMLQTLRKGDSQQQFRKFIGRLKDQNNVWVRVPVVNALWAIHAMCVFVLYRWLADRVHIKVSEDVGNAIQWINTLLVLATGVYMLQHTVFMLINTKPPLPRFPILILLLFTDCFTIPKIIQEPERRQKKNRKWEFTISLFLSVLIISYVLAYVLWVVARRLTEQTNTTSTTAQSAANEITSVITEDGEIGSEDGDRAGRSEHALDSFDSDAETLNASNDQGGTNEALTSNTVPPRSEPAADDEVIVNPTGTTDTNGAPNSPMTADTDADDETKDPLVGKILLWAITIVAVPVGVLLIYSGIWVVGEEASKEITAEQRAAERGEAAPHTARRSWKRKLRARCETITWREVRVLILEALQWPIRFILRCIIVMMWRLLLSGLSLFGYTFNWCQRKVESNSRDILVVAFGIVNFVSASIYYLCFFDATGTSSPSWNSILG